METVDAFEVVDSVSGTLTRLAVRAGDGLVELSLAVDDQLEVSLDSGEAKRLAAALLRGSRVSRGEPDLGEVA